LTRKSGFQKDWRKRLTETGGRKMDGSAVKESIRKARGTVKWFDVARGFGFVTLEDGTGEAFLHVSALKDRGVGSVGEGDGVEVTVSLRPKGLFVDMIHGLDRLSAAEMWARDRPDSGPDVVGWIKFVDRRKGYGFIGRDSGGDVYFGIGVLDRCGLSRAEPDLPVRARTVLGPRGLVADAIGRA
jgi:CspA family cold shock protein